MLVFFFSTYSDFLRVVYLRTQLIASFKMCQEHLAVKTEIHITLMEGLDLFGQDLTSFKWLNK